MKLEEVTHAISIRQPWAWLVAAGWKDIENRSQCFKYRGPIAIHAPLKNADGDGRLESLRRLYEEAESRYGHKLTAVEKETLAVRWNDWAWEPSCRGAIIGIATIVSCRHPEDAQPYSRWFQGPHGLVVNNAELIKPVPWRGQLGIWRLTR